MHILGLPTDIFNVYPASVKFKTYQARWQIGDIYVSGDARKTEDNPQGLGCYLVMTGRGCDDIFRILDSRNYTFGDMFRRCERRYGVHKGRICNTALRIHVIVPRNCDK